MQAQTFVIGIVLALGLGIFLAALWFRAKPVPSAPPIADTLARMEAHIRQVEAERQHLAGSLEQQISALSKETIALSQALRVPNARGRWGELTLRRVTELAGMEPYCDFYEQETGNHQRPDMLVRLPGGRTLAVDAKVPLSAFLDAHAAQDTKTRHDALQRHGQQLARHVAQLSTREYWAHFKTAPEMVVLFLAGEHFLSAALETQPDLLETALSKKIVIATPVTLISVLKGVAYGWRQEKLAQNAEEIRRIGNEFYDRMRMFGETYAETGRQLSKTLETYNRSAGCWDSRVLPALRRMSELGVGGTQAPPKIPAPDGIVREPQPPSQRPQ